MVVSSNCRMRLLEFDETAGGIIENIPLSIRAMKPKILRCHMIGKPADVAAFAEISAPTNIMAATTAAAIELISASANDNQSAAGHVQSLQVIGIDTNDEIVERQEVMHATDGTTFQLTTNTYKEVFHAYADAHGTGDMDAAGQIDVRKIDDTILVSIAAAGNESNGSSFLVPDNHVCLLMGGRIIRLTSAAIDEGVRVRIVYVDPIDGETGMIAADRTNNWIELSVGIYEREKILQKRHMFIEGTRISFEHSSLTDAGEDYDLELDFLIWKK